MPLSFPGIVSGITMVFVPSMTTFAISDLLGARKIMLIGNIIEQGIFHGCQLESGIRAVLGTDGFHPHQYGGAESLR